MSSLITFIDTAMAAWFAPLWRVLIWGTLCGAFSMFMYALLSPQKKITALKTDQKEARRALLKHDGDFAGLQAHILRDLSLSLKQIAHMLIPFLIAAAPVAFITMDLYPLYDGQNYTSFGPEWTQGFTFWYVGALTLASIIVKWLGKIA